MGGRFPAVWAAPAADAATHAHSTRCTTAPDQTAAAWSSQAVGACSRTARFVRPRSCWSCNTAGAAQACRVVSHWACSKLAAQQQAAHRAQQAWQARARGSGTGRRGRRRRRRRLTNNIGAGHLGCVQRRHQLLIALDGAVLRRAGEMALSDAIIAPPSSYPYKHHSRISSCHLRAWEVQGSAVGQGQRACGRKSAPQSPGSTHPRRTCAPWWLCGGRRKV